MKKEEIVLLEEYLVAKLTKLSDEKWDLAKIFLDPVNEDGSINNLYNEERSQSYYLESLVVKQTIKEMREGIAEFISACEEDEEDES